MDDEVVAHKRQYISDVIGEVSSYLMTDRLGGMLKQGTCQDGTMKEDFSREAVHGHTRSAICRAGCRRIGPCGREPLPAEGGRSRCNFQGRPLDSQDRSLKSRLIRRVNDYYRARWREAGIEPAKPVDELSVIRRLSLALTATIPSLEELRSIENVPAGSKVDAAGSGAARLHDRRYRAGDRASPAEPLPLGLSCRHRGRAVHRLPPPEVRVLAERPAS